MMKIGQNTLSRWVLVVVLCIFGFLAKGFAAEVAENPVTPRPTLVPVPTSVAGVTNAVATLTGWVTKASPQGDFWSDATDLSTWTPAGRGGRGFRGGGGGGDQSKPYTSAFRTKLSLPADWAGKRVIARFDGVADGSTLWVIRAGGDG